MGGNYIPFKLLLNVQNPFSYRLFWTFVSKIDIYAYHMLFDAVFIDKFIQKPQMLGKEIFSVKNIVLICNFKGLIQRAL